ncbi:MAG: hypothetical protein H0V34_00635 [Gammaproteobacteria bacterium]|nr:hypothetical protein [Gammaproteobacteria bacterium]
MISFAGFDIIAGGLKTNAGTTFVILKDWSELPRLSRRLQLLRGWSHEQSNEVFSGSTGAGGADGVRAPG